MKRLRVLMDIHRINKSRYIYGYYKECNEYKQIIICHHHIEYRAIVTSLELINDHTPTDVQLYMIKARIFKVTYEIGAC
jgi:hypothetical protein